MLAKLNLCAKKIIIITGMTRSGKSLLCPIISSLKDSEQFFFNTIAENILQMHYMKKINFNVADHLIKKTINECIYDKILGRNLNTKKSDFTSINLYKNKKIYMKRIGLPKSKNLENSIELKKNTFPILFHSGFINLPLIQNSFNNPDIINISRHPVDLISSWLKKNYGRINSSSTIITSCTYNYNNYQLPFWCFGIEKEFIKQKTNEDRILRIIFNLNNKFKKNYLKLKSKKNVYLIKMDTLVTQPNKSLENICDQFKLRKSIFLKQVLREQRCPRIIDLEKRKKNEKKILSNLSNDNKVILGNMIRDYESNTVTF